MKSRVVLVHRRRQVADMYLKGRPQMEIAGQLAVSQMTVSRDLANTTTGLMRWRWRFASPRVCSRRPTRPGMS
jgi:FixJ family two-component response regulator